MGVKSDFTPYLRLLFVLTRLDGAILTRQLESGSVQTHVIRIRLRTRRASSYPDNSSFTGFYLSFTGLFVPSFMMELPSANRHSTAAPS
ncbi:hypothetical protein JHK84_034302 [Glycine max]|nr:hypothetical protein JHK85_034674 [Glycine max]KAG4986349.1 hypothetical protein JHK86_034040 [Glycine max]KAG5140534.1 hypothetical protein JHK84_034302 [Glycine max]